MDRCSRAEFPSACNQTVDGIAVPTVRRIHGYDDEQQKIPDPVLVAIDITDLQFSRTPSPSG
jgi:hypothetical protein